MNVSMYKKKIPAKRGRVPYNILPALRGWSFILPALRGRSFCFCPPYGVGLFILACLTGPVFLFLPTLRGWSFYSCLPYGAGLFLFRPPYGVGLFILACLTGPVFFCFAHLTGLVFLIRTISGLTHRP
jgi:hypothetical protein